MYLKKNLKSKWKIYFYMLLGLYIFLIIALLLIRNSVPILYNEKKENEINIVQNTISEIIVQSDSLKKDEALRKLIKEIPSEIIIISDDYVFKTLEISDMKYFENSINNDMLSYKSSYTEMNNQIYIAIYLPKFRMTISLILNIIVIIMFLLSTILSLLIFILFKKLIKPINRLKKIISKIKEYDLEIEETNFKNEYDELSKELNIFSSNLKNNFDNLIEEYNEIEKKLRIYQEVTVYKTNLILSLVHELKTPLNILMIENQRIESQDLMVIEYTKEVNMVSQIIFKKINEIMEIINTDRAEMKNELIDVVKVFHEVLKLFIPILKKKKIYYLVESEESQFILINPIEFKQIIHNIISNIAAYAKESSSAEFYIEVTKDNLQIKAFNEVKDLEKVEVNKVFNLFYHSGKGSGVGLYTVQKMVESYNGTCKFEKMKTGVLLSIEIPLNYEKK